MSGDRLAQDYVARAAPFWRHARESLEAGELAVALRLAQESSELSMKGVLRWAGIDYPRDHDVGEVLGAERERLPPWFMEGFLPLVPATAELARLRGKATHGLEVEGVPASQLFADPDAAARLVGVAAQVLRLAERLLASRAGAASGGRRAGRASRPRAARRRAHGHGP